MLAVPTSCKLVGNQWLIKGDPFILTRLECMFPLAVRKENGKAISIPASPEQSRDLLWFRTRYPMQVDQELKMRSQAATYMVRQMRAESIINGKQKLEPIQFAKGQSPRDYQQVAAELWKSVQGLLLADEVGLGKTITGITGIVDPSLRPACVVVPVHLCRQWQSQLKRFVPSLKSHIVATTSPYPLNLITDCPSCGAVVDTYAEMRSNSDRCPICKHRIPTTAPRRVPDLTIVSYSKLQGWVDTLAKHCRSVIYDEAHALRGGKTERWKAASRLSRAMQYRLLMTATPLYNLGGEAYNLIECTAPGLLGTKENFQQAWCEYAASTKEPPLREPDSFGSYLRSQKVMVRRSAAEVGIPVHDCEIIHHTVDADLELFQGEAGRAEELAQILLDETVRKRGTESMEFDSVMRQATGIAKVPAVAEFARMILEQDESVVLFAWHRAVHDLLYEKLFDFNPVMYTGTESAAQKEAAVHRFQSKDSKVILVSLRAGEGLDGLQHASCTAIVAELDWTWSVAKQNIGRIARDGQTRPCRAYFLVSEFGSDPVVAQVLGLKKDQLNGLLGDRPNGPVKAVDSSAALKELARNYLAKRGR